VKRTIATAVVFALVFTLTACATKAQNRYEADFLILFDTKTTIVGYAPTKEEFTKFANMIHDDLETYHQLYDIYHDYEGVNNIKTINDNAGVKPVKVDRKIIDLLAFSKKEYYDSQGEMNIAMGSVLSIWHKYREDGLANPDSAQLPPEEDLIAASAHMNIEDLVIDEGNSTVFLKDSKMSLDVGSVAKGYATEQVCRDAEKQGYKSGLVSVGGNVRAIGRNDVTGKPWNVGIQNPDMESPEKDIVLVKAEDSAVVTSGDYQRYYWVDGKKYHHLIDKDTLYPSTYFTAVTILCKDSGVADALTTAIYNMPFEDGLKFIEARPGLEAMWVFKDGTMQYSPHFKDYLTEIK